MGITACLQHVIIGSIPVVLISDVFINFDYAFVKLYNY